MIEAEQEGSGEQTASPSSKESIGIGKK